MTFKETVLAGVLASLIPTGVIGALVWSSQGGLVHALGGITPEDLDKIKRSVVPTRAVVAFESTCPPGWIFFKRATSRVIIGASTTNNRDDDFDIQMDKYDGQALQLLKVGAHSPDGLRVAISSDTDRRRSASYVPPVWH